jgi:hypothetical protein
VLRRRARRKRRRQVVTREAVIAVDRVRRTDAFKVLQEPQGLRVIGKPVQCDGKQVNERVKLGSEMMRGSWFCVIAFAEEESLFDAVCFACELSDAKNVELAGIG